MAYKGYFQPRLAGVGLVVGSPTLGVQAALLGFAFLALPLQPGGESREFCVQMLKMEKLYTRDEIDQMSAILGYSVWLRRGGWYTVPNTDPPLHIPHCRHEWKQRIVRRKSNG